MKREYQTTRRVSDAWELERLKPWSERRLFAQVQKEVEEACSKEEWIEPERIVITSEEWRDIPGEPNYQASNMGYIKNLKTGRILNPTPNKDGYKHVSVNRRQTTVHILIALAFLGERPVEPNGLTYIVNHIDLNKSNCRLDNLEYITRGENTWHYYVNEGHQKLWEKSERERNERTANATINPHPSNQTNETDEHS